MIMYCNYFVFGYDIANSVIRASATCSTGSTMIWAFSTKGINDGAGSESFRKLSCSVLVLCCRLPEACLPSVALDMLLGWRVG